MRESDRPPSSSGKSRGRHPGMVHVISAMEACDASQPWHDKQTHRTFLRPDSGKVHSNPIDLRHVAGGSSHCSFGIRFEASPVRIWPVSLLGKRTPHAIPTRRTGVKARRLARDNAERERAAAAVKTWLLAQIG